MFINQFSSAPRFLYFNRAGLQGDQVLEALGRVVHVVEKDLGGLRRGPAHLRQLTHVKVLPGHAHTDSF